ncbi:MULTISPECIES: putative Ig domain-containing protein [unclassified Methanosarcina]|uniref:putative Ig domain-containing protein n=1 Tax=unclassified Methanosarcina TaxID=2644672 RepID=UPI001F36270B|nr:MULTISPECIES: putative Ig domain-containing protein [unclassified Methanosarcina]
MTSKNCSYGAQLISLNGRPVGNITLIDSNFINSQRKDLWISEAINSRFINVNYTTTLYGNSNVEAAFYYYSDILIKSNTGYSIPNSTLSFTNPLKANVQSVDAYGDDKSTFRTNSNGQTDLPETDRKNSPVLAEKYKSSTVTYNNLSYTATITTPEGRTVSLSGITPDSSWYRKDPNVPTYTITAIIPEDSKGPHLTGFAPSTDNPFNPGEKKNFRVWTDEPLTEMEWYVDGSDSPVSKGSLNYAWPVTEGNHTIKFTGSNANGPVSWTWPLGESSGDQPGQDDELPAQNIEFSPADAVLTRNVSESVVFSVSPDIFTTKEWYVNGERVLNNMASMSRGWDKAGTYNVTFSGFGSGESVLHTWTVDVIGDTSEPQNVSITSITPEYQVVTPGKQFDLNIKVDPETAITGAQLNFVFNSSMVSANVAKEGDLFKQNGAQTLFSSGTIDKSAGKVKNIYGFIIGTSTVSSPGTMATVNLTAGNSTGIAEFSLSNVLISDANSKSTPYTVTSSTVLIDTAPVMNPICCPKSVDEKSTLTFKVGAKDADGNSLTYSASGLPEGAGFNTTSGLFTWTPAVGQAGVYTFTFEVSDGYLTDSKNVTVTVNRLNNLPVINYFEPLNGAFFSEGEKINISVNASDADGQALKYSLMIDGVECSTDPAYVWDTDYSSSGNHTISLAVSDGIDEVKEQHSIYINNYHPRWDVNEDGIVNILDITIIAQNYGTDTKKPYPRWDVNQDGVVNIQDLTLAGYYFGEIVI